MLAFSSIAGAPSTAIWQLNSSVSPELGSSGWKASHRDEGMLQSRASKNCVNPGEARGISGSSYETDSHGEKAPGTAETTVVCFLHSHEKETRTIRWRQPNENARE